jgi:hypothetical protein
MISRSSFYGAPGAKAIQAYHKPNAEHIAYVPRRS